MSESLYPLPIEESEPFRTIQKMWSMTTVNARRDILLQLTALDNFESPIEVWAQKEYDDLPSHIVGCLMFAATPDGWNPENWHKFAKIIE